MDEPSDEEGLQGARVKDVRTRIEAIAALAKRREFRGAHVVARELWFDSQDPPELPSQEMQAVVGWYGLFDQFQDADEALSPGLPALLENEILKLANRPPPWS